MSAPIRWVEVRALVPIGWQELVAETLTIGPCASAAFGRPNLGVDPAPSGFEYVRTFLPDHADGPELRRRLLDAVGSLAERTGSAELAGVEVTFRELPHEDYLESWRKTWRPFRLAPLCLLPSWDDRSLEPGEIRLTVEPGGSFGSGRHATTRACLRALTRRIRGGERVLDAGCGSGILSVAAVRLGADRAFGFDIDPNAERAASKLAGDNGVADRCRFSTGGFEVLGGGSGTFDVVLANIYSDVLIQHAGTLQRQLAPDGWFAFSGCPAHRADTTRSAIVTAGLQLEQEVLRGRWHTFLGVRA